MSSIPAPLSLQLLMQDWTGNNQTMIYHSFSIQNEANKYRLSVSGAHGYLPDDLAHNNNMYFATYDRPDPYNCAINQRSGWWFNYCSYTLPNGVYYHGGKYSPNPGGYYDGVYYKDWQGYDYSLKYMTMLLYY